MKLKKKIHTNFSDLVCVLGDVCVGVWVRGGCGGGTCFQIK